MTDDLVARLERLSGPDREVDATIALKVGAFKLSVSRTSIWDMTVPNCGRFVVGKSNATSALPYTDEEAERSLARTLSLLRYTASIDAAMTLLRRPFGDCVELVITIYDGHCNARLQRRGMYAGEETVLAEGDASEPACAIAACALRSRTTEGK